MRWDLLFNRSANQAAVAAGATATWTVLVAVEEDLGALKILLEESQSGTGGA